MFASSSRVVLVLFVGQKGQMPPTGRDEAVKMVAVGLPDNQSSTEPTNRREKVVAVALPDHQSWTDLSRLSRGPNWPLSEEQR